MIELLSGNDAIARGAFEAGVRLAAGYPGTPSTEILEAIAARYKGDIYCEWSPNEKVAYEVAMGASLAGARALVTMKHVGLNVAADPLMTSAYTGAVGAMIVVVADDPGMHSSQNEQDSRHYARFAKIPMLEPADSREARDFMKLAVRVSEEFGTPVILRTETRVSHSRSLVELGERSPSPRAVNFDKNPQKFVTVPGYARKMRVALEERLARLKAAAEVSPVNRVEFRGRELGIITSGISYQYVREVWPEASVLKLGWSFPFPDKLLREFAAGVKRVLVVEELDDILEEHVKALGIAADGRNFVPGIGEHSPAVLAAVRAKMDGHPPAHIPIRVQPVAQAADLPARPPVLCSGCPHRGVFYALHQHDVVVTGDIGCYALGFMKPLERLDTILCMGASVTMAHGMAKAGNPRKVVGIIGDSTFFHSGVTGLLDVAYNKSNTLLIVVDNRTTAMTGHQDHPGTGKTLMGEPAHEASIEAIARACGIRRVHTVNPHDFRATMDLVQQELAATEPSLIVARGPCVLHEGAMGPAVRLDEETCVQCGECLGLGCPALESLDGQPRINAAQCAGCLLCSQVCAVSAIAIPEEVRA